MADETKLQLLQAELLKDLDEMGFHGGDGDDVIFIVLGFANRNYTMDNGYHLIQDAPYEIRGCYNGAFELYDLDTTAFIGFVPCEFIDFRMYV